MVSHLGGLQGALPTTCAYQHNSVTDSSFTVGALRPGSLGCFGLSQMFFSVTQWGHAQGLGELWGCSPAIVAEFLPSAAAEWSVKVRPTVSSLFLML